MDITYYSEEKLRENYNDYLENFDIITEPDDTLGSFSSIFTIQNKKTNKQFIVKKLNKNKYKDNDDKYTANFINELRLLHSLKIECNKYILCYEFAFLDNNNEYNIITEKLIDSYDLQQILTDTYLYNKYSDYFEELCNQLIEGIKKIHFLDIAHRDIKPQNIVCSLSNNILNVKYIDFGLSCDNILKDNCENNKYSGSIEYMSPEFIKKLKANNDDNEDNDENKNNINKLHFYELRNNDLWSVGLIIYMLLSNNIIFTIDADEFKDYDPDDFDDNIREKIEQINDFYKDNSKYSYLEHLTSLIPEKRNNGLQLIKIENSCTSCSIMNKYHKYKYKYIKLKNKYNL